MRASEQDVRIIIDNTVDISLRPFMRVAEALTDKVEDEDSDGVLTSALLKEIETWLAAHFYAIRDPQPQSKSTGKASATLQGQTGKGLELTHWGQTAMMLDVSGYLQSINKAGRVKLLWIGTPEEERESVDSQSN